MFTAWYSHNMLLLCPGYKQGDDVRLAVNTTFYIAELIYTFEGRCVH